MMTARRRIEAGGRVIHEAREADVRLRTLAAIVSFVLLTLNDGARAQQSERSVDTSPAWNDNSLITCSAKGRKPRSFERRQNRVLWTRCIQGDSAGRYDGSHRSLAK